MRADGTAASLAAFVRGKTRNPGQLGEFEQAAILSVQPFSGVAICKATHALL
jgi:hypothetical protein